MHKFQEIQDQAFQDATSIITRLGNVSSAEELVNAADDLAELRELVTFLQRFNTYSLRLTESVSEAPVSQSLSTVFFNENPEFEGNTYIAEEEVIFNNNFNQIEDSEIDHPEMGVDVLEEEAAFNNELNEIDRITHIEPDLDEDETESYDSESETEPVSNTEESAEEVPVGIDEDSTAEVSVQDEHQQINTDTLTVDEDSAEEPESSASDMPLKNVSELQTAENNEEKSKTSESRRQIVDFEHEQKMQELNDAAEKLQEQHEEKKFKLSSIKGLKRIQSLFDDDPLEDVIREEHSPAAPADSLRKSNIPTDFMEAAKPKPEFRLDLNDKIAFSKMLFGGSQSKLNETIRDLNSFATLEEAREYLSDAYYENNWEKSDEYAQRLWNLVESKFL